ncbi:MAG: hypothetical protein ABI068_00675 [Ktedonobacterales bacterium]
MRMLMRVGAIVGVLGLALVYVLQIAAGLMTLAGVVVVGAVTGLSVAKWLTRDWYGRQFAAGLRAGAIACCVTGAGALLFLLLQGPHSVAALAARSHLPGVTLAPQIQAFAALGWVSIDVLGTLVSVGLGIALAALVAQVFAGSKSRHALQIIAQARLAAQAFNQSLGHTDSWGPVAVGMGRSTSTLGGLTGQQSAPGRMGSAAPFSGTGAPLAGANYTASYNSTSYNGGYGVPSGMTMPAGSAASPASPYSGTYSTPYAGSQSAPYSEPYAAPGQPSPAAGSAAWPADSGPWAVINAANASYANVVNGQASTPMAEAPQQPPASTDSASNNASSSGKSRRRKTANQQPAQPSASDEAEANLSPRPPAMHASNEALTDGMRDALAAWANNDDENDEDDASDGRRTRDHKASSYLNSEPPKRTRKKQNTRDWLC